MKIFSKKKEKEIKIDRNISNALEPQYFEDEIIKTKDGYMDILEIEGKDIFSLNKSELERNILMFHALYKVIVIDGKLLSMKFPVNTQEQREYVSYKISKAKSKVQKDILTDKLFELEYLEKNRDNKGFYCLLFAEKADSVRSARSTFIRTLSYCAKVYEIEEVKKRLILKKLFNQNSKIEYRREDSHVI